MTVLHRRKVSSELTRDEFIAFIIIYLTIHSTERQESPSTRRRVWYHHTRINRRRDSLPCALFSRLSPLTGELVIDLNAILIGRKRSLPRVKLRAERLASCLTAQHWVFIVGRRISRGVFTILKFIRRCFTKRFASFSSRVNHGLCRSFFYTCFYRHFLILSFSFLLFSKIKNTFK